MKTFCTWAKHSDGCVYAISLKSQHCVQLRCGTERVVVVLEQHVRNNDASSLRQHSPKELINRFCAREKHARPRTCDTHADADAATHWIVKKPMVTTRKKGSPAEAGTEFTSVLCSARVKWHALWVRRLVPCLNVHVSHCSFSFVKWFISATPPVHMLRNSALHFFACDV